MGKYLRQREGSTTAKESKKALEGRKEDQKRPKKVQNKWLTLLHDVKSLCVLLHKSFCYQFMISWEFVELWQSYLLTSVPLSGRFWLWAIISNLTKVEEFFTKIISLGWKLAKLSRKGIFFTPFHKICLTNFPQCWAKFATYCLKGTLPPNTNLLVVSYLFLGLVVACDQHCHKIHYFLSNYYKETIQWS